MLFQQLPRGAGRGGIGFFLSDGPGASPGGSPSGEGCGSPDRPSGTLWISCFSLRSHRGPHGSKPLALQTAADAGHSQGPQLPARARSSAEQPTDPRPSALGLTEALFATRLKPLPRLGRNTGPGLGWGWPSFLTFVACNVFQCDLLFFNRGKLIVVLLLFSLIIPRCLSSGWPWNQFYTEFTPTRVMSGATVSRNPEAD